MYFACLNAEERALVIIALFMHVRFLLLIICQFCKLHQYEFIYFLFNLVPIIFYVLCTLGYWFIFYLFSLPHFSCVFFADCVLQA